MARIGDWCCPGERTPCVQCRRQNSRAAGAAIAIANVLGSKILNNSLLLGVAILAAMYHGGFFTTIPNSELLWFQMMLATSITVVALIPLFKKYIGIRVGIFLVGLYILSIVIQFFAPVEIKPH